LALPGIATNLLADRLRELDDAGLITRTELPAPAARTVYTLSDDGWRRALPVLRALAQFGLPEVRPEPDALTPLNGFLAGVLLAVDDERIDGIDASYRLNIDSRIFEIRLHEGRFAQILGEPAVTVTATAADLITARLAATARERKAALRQITLAGQSDAVMTMRRVFRLSGDPGLTHAA
jgi:hypothetical protein